MKVGEQLQKGHILNFVHNGRTFNPHLGIKTFPQQTYGVSLESPEQFQQQHTLLGDNGYIYKYEDAAQFDYPSQRSYFNVHTCQQNGDPTQIHQTLLNNSLAFHRKKGRLSEFMDKNGWISAVMPLMGFERTDDARNVSNAVRKKRINSLKPRVAYENPAEPKTKINQQYFNKISGLMSEKVRIRKKRQDLMKGQIPAAPRIIAEQNQPDPLHLQNVEERMAKTTKDFYSTSSTFYHSREANYVKQRSIISRRTKLNSVQINREQKMVGSPNGIQGGPSPQISYSTISPKKGSRTVQLKKIEDENLQGLNLEDWYRKSCHSKWHFRPKKTDSQERMEEDVFGTTAL